MSGKNSNLTLEDILVIAHDHYRKSQPDQAAEAFDEAIALNEACAEAHAWRAEIAVQQDDYPTAVHHYDKAYMLMGHGFEDYSKFGLSLYELSEGARAVEMLEKAIAIDPEDLVAHTNLGRALYELFSQGNKDQARKAAHKWVQSFPNNRDACFMSAAILGQTPPAKPDPLFVKDVFDDFAEDFDRKLADIQYSVPTKIANIVTKKLPNKKAASLLDLGCGTGLCGEALKNRFDHIIGVDLSQKMLNLAEDRQCYDQLIESDIEQVLAQYKDQEKHFDAIIAGDCFCYLGAMEVILNLIADCLSPKGLMVASFEKLITDEDQNLDYCLNPSGRYSHRPEYLSNVMKEIVKNNGFSNFKLTSYALRQEYGQWVQGIIIIAEK